MPLAYFALEAYHTLHLFVGVRLNTSLLSLQTMLYSVFILIRLHIMIYTYTRFVAKRAHPMIGKGFKGAIGLACASCGSDRWSYDTPSAQRGCIDDSEVAVRCMDCANKARGHSSSYYNQLRMFTLMDRTPTWCDREAVLAFYDKCPAGYVVDHIIPLKGDFVSGLHVAGNLQYLTPEANTAKSNKY